MGHELGVESFKIKPKKRPKKNNSAIHKMKSVMHSVLKSSNCKQQRFFANYSAMMMLGNHNQRFSQRASFSTRMGQQHEIKKLSSEDVMKLENDYSAHKYVHVHQTFIILTIMIIIVVVILIPMTQSKFHHHHRTICTTLS